MMQKVPDERLAQYGLSIAQVWNQLSTQNSRFEAGKFDAGTERIRIAQTSEFQSLEDIRRRFCVEVGTRW